MSDGIVQNVFSGSKAMLDRNCKQFTYNDVIVLFELAEERLKEEIKKEIQHHRNCEIMGTITPTCNFVKRLIGDNE